MKRILIVLGLLLLAATAAAGVHWSDVNNNLWEAQAKPERTKHYTASNGTPFVLYLDSVVRHGTAVWVFVQSPAFDWGVPGGMQQMWFNCGAGTGGFLRPMNTFYVPPNSVMGEIMKEACAKS